MTRSDEGRSNESRSSDGRWTPFRPTGQDLEAIGHDVEEIRTIQRTILEGHDDLHVPDRVAHQYQIAGGPVRLRVADALPAELEGVGLFVAGAEHLGVGRVSTGLGTPHVEPGLDFLGLMVAFRTADGPRVDLLGINHPASPTCDHREFLDVLHATGQAADAGVPFLGGLGDRDLIDTAAEQTEFVVALARRMGLGKALRTARHLVGQTTRTFRSRTAYQSYWTGVVESGGTAGKFSLVPAGDTTPRPAEGERRLTEEWQVRQGAEDVVFDLYWIPWIDEEHTPTAELTRPWAEEHRQRVGRVVFPRLDPAADEAGLWATLASEMGVNPGHWVRDRSDSVPEPGTEFGVARKMAYGISQEGRGALEPDQYAEVFRTGRMGAELAAELRKRRTAKERTGHVSWAPRSVPALILAGVLLSGACGGEPAPDGGAAGASDADRGPDAVAAQLRPAVQLEGEPSATWSLEERMAHHAVPGVSVAVMEDGAIAWARAWGVADTETGTPVTPTTLFQAASISKPVAALTAMALVEDGALALDGPVNRHLTSWQVPDNEFTADSAVTLRGLLTHTAGLTVWGFPGYRKDRPFASGQPLATNIEVLDGAGNTDPVRVFKVPGTSWRYSGGGYTVAEQMVEDVTGRPFAEVARTRVLEPAGMTRSTYEQPLPDVRWVEAARGHAGDGAEVEGEWHTYPEQAAAGLWTTPTDLLTLSAHLRAILGGETTDGVVSRETLEAMLVPHRADEEGFDDYGLGFGIGGDGPDRTFGHGGANAGFRAQWTVYPERGQGVVVMTNGDRGGALATEIVRAVSAVYGWPDFQPEVRAREVRSAEALAPFAGRYAPEGEEEPILTVRSGDGVLTLDVPGQGAYTLHGVPDAPDAFFDASDGQSVTFERDGSGAVVAMVANGQARFARVGGLEGGP